LICKSLMSFASMKYLNFQKVEAEVKQVLEDEKYDKYIIGSTEDTKDGIRFDATLASLNGKVNSRTFSDPNFNNEKNKNIIEELIKSEGLLESSEGLMMSENTGSKRSQRSKSPEYKKIDLETNSELNKPLLDPREIE